MMNARVKAILSGSQISWRPSINFIVIWIKYQGAGSLKSRSLDSLGSDLTSVTASMTPKCWNQPP